MNPLTEAFYLSISRITCFITVASGGESTVLLEVILPDILSNLGSESVENACTSNKFLISECPTRWNSTRDMLKTAIELKDAFFDYDFNNSCFARDLEEIPKRADFEVCKKVVSILEKFKETTKLVSSVSSPVAHLWFGEILDIDKHLHEWQENASFAGMISKMRPKYDKYWGDYKKINHYMYFAVILDPTMKSEIIDYGFKHLIDNGCKPMEVDEESEETPILFLTNDELCDKLVKKVENDMRVLFAMYKEKYGTNLSSDIPKSTSSQSTTTTRRRGNAFLNAFKDKVGNNLIGGEDELTKYLKESRLELQDDEDFDILNWCASGRILDPYRNSLAPNIVEALVCTQDWIRTSSKNITMDTLEDLMKDDELAKEIQEGLDQQNGKGKNVAA
nr:zinc finger BED domain-containing protein RICESLEEPER 2 [Tanacetum cinerariifolium]